MTYLKVGINQGNFITSMISLGKTPPNIWSTATRCLQHFITQCRLYNSTFHYVVQVIRQHISFCSAGYTTAHFIMQCRLYDSTFHFVVQAIRQHISFRSAGYTTAHFTQIDKFSENIFEKFVTVGPVRHAAHLTQFIQFRERASLVHWKTAKFVMTETYWQIKNSTKNINTSS